jgi:hypothetical protein
MKIVTVYDPAMCCSSGICGAEVDQALVTFAADLDWLKSEGISVTRINLAQEPGEFAANETVKSVLQNEGVEGLPVILLDGVMHSSGRYPTRGELAEMTDMVFSPDTNEALAKTHSSSCCGGNKKSEKASSGCC